MEHFQMNTDMFSGILRHVLTIAAGGLVSKGVINANDAQMAVGAVVALAGIGWSVWSKRKPA
jgi:hypothetical protein